MVIKILAKNTKQFNALLKSQYEIVDTLKNISLILIILKLTYQFLTTIYRSSIDL